MRDISKKETWECERHRDSHNFMGDVINYNINISSLLPLGLPMEIDLYFSKLVFFSLEIVEPWAIVGE